MDCCLKSYRIVQFVLVSTLLVSASGCTALLTTGAFLWEGGYFNPAECTALEGKRVVVVCRPPSSSEYSHAGASREISKRVSRLLAENVPDIDIVNPREVDNWLDESDWDKFEELADAVNADIVLHIELETFDLFKGKTLYQGNSDVTISVYDMNENANLVWDKPLGEVLFPRNSGIPQDRPVRTFQREFADILAKEISLHFYKHDPHSSFAIDALADRQ